MHTSWHPRVGPATVCPPHLLVAVPTWRPPGGREAVPFGPSLVVADHGPGRTAASEHNPGGIEAADLAESDREISGLVTIHIGAEHT